MAILARAAHPRVSGIRLLLAPAGHPLRQEGVAQLQHAARPLSGRRRHEDRLHLRVRLQSGGDRDPRRQAADRGGAGRALVARCARSRPRNCWSAAFTANAAVLADALARHGRFAAAGQRRAAQPARRHVRRAPQAAGHRGRGRSAAIASLRRIRPMRSSCRPASARTPKARPCCRTSSSASRCRSSPGRTQPSPGDQRRVSVPKPGSGEAGWQQARAVTIQPEACRTRRRRTWPTARRLAAPAQSRSAPRPRPVGNDSQVAPSATGPQDAS